MTTLTNKLNTNSLNEQQLFQELDNDVAENYNGGVERFNIANQTRANITYNLDGKLWKHLPRKVWRWTTSRGGNILFDRDVRSGVKSYKRYNLANGKTYAFQVNRSTPNPYDIDLYDIS